MGAVHCHGIRGSQLTNRFPLIIIRRSLIRRRTKTDLMSMVMGAMMLETKVVMIVLMLTAATIKLAMVQLLYCSESCIFVQHKVKEIGWLKPSKELSWDQNSLLAISIRVFSRLCMSKQVGIFLSWLRSANFSLMRSESVKSVHQSFKERPFF